MKNEIFLLKEELMVVNDEIDRLMNIKANLELKIKLKDDENEKIDIRFNAD